MTASHTYVVYLQVERALTLWRDGHISRETIAAHKAKKLSSAIIKTINKATGKESTKTTDFNQPNWGPITNGYLLSIKKALSSPSKLNPIIKAAKSFMKATSRFGDSTAFNSMVERDTMPVDERALLCDDSESELEPQAEPDCEYE